MSEHGPELRAQEHDARARAVRALPAARRGSRSRSRSSTSPSSERARGHLPRPAGGARRGDPARRQGPVRHRRARHDLRLDPLRRPRAGARRPRRCGGSRRPATRTSARRTCTSSPTARPPRTRTSGRCRTRSRRAGSPAARAAARRRRSPPGSPTRRSAPTPAARSGSRPPAAASSASSRPTGSCRSTAASRSRRASTTPGRWPATSTSCARMMEALAPGFEPAEVDARATSRSASPGPSRRPARPRAGRGGRGAASRADGGSSCRSRTASTTAFRREVADVHRELFPEHADEYGENVRPKLERASPSPTPRTSARASGGSTTASSWPRPRRGSTWCSPRRSPASRRPRRPTSSRCAAG